MDFGTEAGIFLAYTSGLLMIYFFGRILLVPLKKLFKLVVNSLVGGLILLAINIAGAAVGLVMPVNLLTSLIAGLLGIPGVVGLLVYFNFFA